MANHDNLIPQNKRTKDEQREIARKGGIASGKVRRRKANLKKALDIILSSEVPNPSMVHQLQELGFENSMEMAIMVQLAQQALKGNMRAIELVMKVQDVFERESEIHESRRTDS